MTVSLMTVKRFMFALLFSILTLTQFHGLTMKQHFKPQWTL
nr:MAG TPA: hypothetical protein [Caudoviricetes sp.]